MARKGRKTRWRKLPIPIGNNQGETSCSPHHVPHNLEPENPSSPSPKEQVSRVTFNEDEYTKITTPRQDMLFKKGYLSRKRPQPQEQPIYNSGEPPQSPSESVESEQYVGCDDNATHYQQHPFVYPTGYMDPNGLFYLNGGSYEVYDPYTNSVTVIVGPNNGYPNQHVLAAVPCHPVPLHPIEWFQPPPQQQPVHFKKRNSTDSQNWGSSQSCESPSSGQELETADSSLFYPQPQYIYPGYMFGGPMYNINGVNVQGAAAPPPHHQPLPADHPKRRKKRRKRRRPGMGDEGSESSCEEVAGSGVSSDAGQGSSCSKTTDSGVHTGADSPQPQPLAKVDIAQTDSPPPPEVSTEEEPSQPSVEQPITFQPRDLAQRVEDVHSAVVPATPTPSDSSTEDDDTNPQEHLDTALQEIITQTENIDITESTNDRLQEESEPEGKEEEIDPPCSVQEIPKQETVSTEMLPDKEEKIMEEQAEIVFEGIKEDEVVLKIMREESDEWLNAKENGSENEEEQTRVVEITEETPKDEPQLEAIQTEYKEDIEECIAEETGYSEEGWGSAEETSVEERWAMAELGEEVTVDKPITEAVTRWLESQGTGALVPQQPIESEDEGIGEETSSPTGPKNVKGNPFPVRYPSTGTRVACDSLTCESREFDAWKDKCDPLVSVDRYYRLGAEQLPSAPCTTSPCAAFKTATSHHHPGIVHIDPSSPFPCGLVCCILQ